MASEFINKHITRALAAGADPTTINSSWLTAVDNWLTPSDNLLFWADAGFGVIKSSANAMSKAMCLGTTRLPRGGDYTTELSSITTYVSSAINGRPGWVNTTASARGYFGSARTGSSGGLNNNSQRYNNLRRLHYTGVSFVATYQKSHGNMISLLNIAEFGGLSLRHSSVGQLEFRAGGFSNTWTVIANGSSTLGTSVVNVIGGTWDGQTLELKAYIEGSPGVTQLTTTAIGDGASHDGGTALLGGINGNFTSFFLGSGSTNSKMSLTTHSVNYSRIYSDAQAQFSAANLIVFGTPLSSTRMSSLHAMLRGYVNGTIP